MDEFKYEDTYFFFVKGTPAACSAMYRRALTALAKETALVETLNSVKPYDLFEPPYLFSCRQVNGYTMITMAGGFGEGYVQQLSADGIEGVEEFITMVYSPGAAHFGHDDNEGKIVKHLDDFGLGYISQSVSTSRVCDNAEIVGDFRNRERSGKIVLDYDTDVAPLLGCDTLRYVRIQGYSMSSVFNELSNLRYSTDDLHRVKRVVFELSIHPNLKIDEVEELCDLSRIFEGLPQDPEVVCGLIKDANQEMPIELRVLTV